MINFLKKSCLFLLVLFYTLCIHYLLIKFSSENSFLFKFEILLCISIYGSPFVIVVNIFFPSRKTTSGSSVRTPVYDFDNFKVHPFIKLFFFFYIIIRMFFTILDSKNLDGFNIEIVSEYFRILHYYTILFFSTVFFSLTLFIEKMYESIFRNR